ncbi:MAG: hypothetical protein FJ215_00710 [Ignavibacteria bacterium]|nr:hypothetical protein [Ignavibacteria bacterium]
MSLQHSGICCIITAHINVCALVIQENTATKTLKDTLLQALDSAKYASVKGLRRKLGSKNRIPPSSLYTTLYRLVESKMLFDAGRRWYSTIPTPFKPQYASVRTIARLVEKQFPQLQFSVWSTEQLQPFAHHLMSRFTIFLHTETDAITPVAEYLQGRKYTVYSNPKQTEVEKYVVASDRRIIVRQLVTEEPVDGHYATIEKTLVDLFLEKDRLFLMDLAEFKRIFENIIFAHRINMGRLFRYAERRKVKTSIVKLCSEHKDSIII